MQLHSILITLLFFPIIISAQNTIEGQVTSGGNPLPGANIYIPSEKIGVVSDINGSFTLKTAASSGVKLRISYTGFQSKEVLAQPGIKVKVSLSQDLALDEVVITGTMSQMTKLESPVPVELYSKSFLKKNPAPNIFESLDRVNGVRPQINCSVCNTGDIHINGLEGPYTMVLIDGMPIVSGLSTVYGLSGIPNGIIEQIEIVKGPSSALYGSEAMGGVINVITKLPADKFSGDVSFYATSWLESNLDLSINTPLNKKVSLLSAINYFQYNQPMDLNGDYFTDITLQNRLSLFNKISVKRGGGKRFNLATRIFTEDRWGGELNWESQFAGGDSIYGESITTNRVEAVGSLQFKTEEDLSLNFSYNAHQQKSFYGTTAYNALQQIGFVQSQWQKSIANFDLIAGAGFRYNYYDDNTPATSVLENEASENQPSEFIIPGLLAQAQYNLGKRWTLLAGGRADYHAKHGYIFTPRFAVKVNPSPQAAIRLNGGTGFRVVNVFTEDHAALTGARELVIAQDLNPERSKSLNLNYEQKFYTLNGNVFGWDLSFWYTRFSNQIIPDYTTDPNKIIYDNLQDKAISRGASLNLSAKIGQQFTGLIGASFIDVYQVIPSANGPIKQRPLLSENWTGTWTLSYNLKNLPLQIDYSGNVYGPMLLPVLGPLDPRPDASPWFSIQNLNLSYKLGAWELIGGVKNLLNFTPAANSIARSRDPFDTGVTFDSDENPVATPNNPHALTFDPSYVYAPNQGRRYFVGFNLSF